MTGRARRIAATGKHLCTCLAAGADGAARASAGSRRAKPGKACFSGGGGR